MLACAFCAVPLALVLATAGEGDWSAPVQAASVLYRCPWRLTVGEFVALFCLLKVAALTATSLAAVAVAGLFGSVYGACGALALWTAVEAALYWLVPEASWCAWAREASLFAVTDVGRVFVSLDTVNLGGAVAYGWAIGAASAAAHAVVAAALCRFGWQRAWSPRERARAGWRLGGRVRARLRAAIRAGSRAVLRRRLRPCALLAFEARKLLVENHAAAVSLVFVAVVLARGFGVDQTSTYEHYYRSYAQEVAGLGEQAASEWVAAERARIDDADEQVDEYYRMYADGQIESELTLNHLVDAVRVTDVQKAAFADVEEQLAQVEALRAEEVGARFVDLTGWRRLLGETGAAQMRIGLACLLAALALGLHNLVCMEETSGAFALVVCSRFGWARLRRRKLAAACVWAALLACAQYAVQLWRIASAWGLDGWGDWSVAAGSTLQAGLLSALPLPAFVLLIGAAWVLGGVLLACGMTLVSERAHSRVASLALDAAFSVALVFGLGL